MKKELEFEINDNILSVADFDWYIDRIDAIYVRRSNIGRRDDYAIYIQQGSEIVELYLRTSDELIIASEYGKLCNAIKEVRPKFDNSAEHFVLINYANLNNATLHISKGVNVIGLEFENSSLDINGGKNKHNKILEVLDKANQEDKTI